MDSKAQPDMAVNMVVDEIKNERRMLQGQLRAFNMVLAHLKNEASIEQIQMVKTWCTNLGCALQQGWKAKRIRWKGWET